MILVTVGTTHFPFDRLMTAVSALDVDEEVVVQRGPSEVSVEGAEVVDFLSFDELAAHIERSRLVISHSGVGSIMVALARGRKPIVVPRLARFGEAVDDHQVDVAEQLGRGGRVTVVHDPSSLSRVVATAEGATRDTGLRFGPLVDAIADEVRRAIGTAA
jgi:UDP-N-acetylglucosamine transferase subunit ALG13